MATLTEAHRLAQLALGQQTVTQMLSLWPLLDPKDLVGSFEPWASVSYSVVNTSYIQSTELATAYYLTAREAAGIVDGFSVVPGTLSREQVYRSLFVTGPGRVLSGFSRGESWYDITDRAASSSAGAAMRLALNGGRETLLNSVIRDPRATGWSRVTSGDACEFCEMLAERGVVYSQDSADFASHDNCACSAEPEFGDESVAVRDYTPSERQLSDEQRAARNAGVREFLAGRRNAGAEDG